MLVLSRSHRESVMIGDDIEVKVLRIDTVRGVAVLQIGFDAPREVTILRKEIWDKVQEEKNK